MTFDPFNKDLRSAHLVFTGNYTGTRDVDRIRFKSQPAMHFFGASIADTGTISFVDNYLMLGAEFAVVEGPFSIQSEYIWTVVERKMDTDLDFDSWYAEAAYFLTGESRHYNRGKFGDISPQNVVGQGGFGAWQLAARYDSVDLNDADIEGGKVDSFTVGLNWFPTSTLRFSGNYSRILGVGSKVYNGDEQQGLFQVRGHWEF